MSVFFRKKELDVDLMLRNVANAVLDLWVEPMDIKKFYNVSDFGVHVVTDDNLTHKFFREQLRFISFVAVALCLKETGTKEIAVDVIAAIKDEYSRMKIGDERGHDDDLGEHVAEYLTARFEGDAKTAGKEVENLFSLGFIGEVPGDERTDARYVLYAQLSLLERRSMFALSRAIKRSYR